MNNNPQYSKDYVAGGKRAAQGKGEKKVPRLIVEFTVENKAKAKQQADRRARQLQNVSNQKMAKANRDDNDEGEKGQTASKKKKKMSRGALQREKKRRLKAEKQNTEVSKIPSANKAESKPSSSKGNKVKPSRPLKRQKIDKEEQAFESMVQKYKSKFMGQVDSRSKNQEHRKEEERAKINKRRWFE